MSNNKALQASYFKKLTKSAALISNRIWNAYEEAAFRNMPLSLT